MPPVQPALPHAPFAARLRRAPIPYDAARGQEALAHIPDLPAQTRDLVAGVAGCAPYLAGLVASEGEWLGQALHHSPEAAMDEIFAQTRALIQSPDLDAGLRGMKRRAALIVALADCGGVWELDQITQVWSDFADACVDVALKTHIASEARRGRIPGQGEEDALRDGAGMVALAMGKMGAGELNYSSDIDLICLFDETRFDAGDEMEARSGFVRATRKLAASLGENTAQGYVFRTDLRLRPDASVTPVCISMAAAERYYEAEGRNWERAAYIKARPAAGDLAAGARFLEVLRPFVWRKYLDFAAIQDTQDMRQRIRSHKGLHGMTLEGHNMKLGAGGIREIEFFAQTRQLVAGGRDPDLRARRTRDALAALAQKGWIGEDTARDLSVLYGHHREVEHRVQMIHDAQTHLLPNTDDGFDRLACFMGYGDTGAFRADLRARLEQVEDLCEPFFTPPKSGTAQAMPDLSDSAQEIIARWPGYACLRASRGREIFERIKPDLLNRLMRAGDPDVALANFDQFLKGLPAGVQLFSLFQSNPSLIDLIGDIAAISPALSRYLSRNVAVLDAVLGGGFFAPFPDTRDLGQSLETALAGLDFEQSLDAARRWLKEWQFRVGVHHLRGLIEADEAATQYTALADCVIAAFWRRACDQTALRHGAVPGRGGVVLAMGSLGAGRLNIGSDLDLIVIYDAGDVDFTDGPRPLDARGWFAKATKSLITALSAATPEGRLYEVDMRLRPSGRQGPVATALSSFRTYQMTEAWVWEHMALTRARVVAGAPDLAADVDAVRSAVITMDHERRKILTDAAQMRARLQAAGRKGSAFDFKPGQGGMQDIELLAQAGALIAGAPARQTARQLLACGKAGVIAAPEADLLRRTHALYATLGQAGRLLTEETLDPAALGQGGQDFLLRAAGFDDIATLDAHLSDLRAQSAAIIEAALAPYAPQDAAP